MLLVTAGFQIHKLFVPKALSSAGSSLRALSSPSLAQRAARPSRLSPRPIRKDGCHRGTMGPTGDLKPRRRGKKQSIQTVKQPIIIGYLHTEDYPIPDYPIPGRRVSNHRNRSGGSRGIAIGYLPPEARIGYFQQEECPNIIQLRTFLRPPNPPKQISLYPSARN